VTGLVAAVFTHRDSRAGDPDLHTRVAVANKVQTLDGRWLSIDGRVLFKATVAASETYNTALEYHLRDRRPLRGTSRRRSEAAAGAGDRWCRPCAKQALVGAAGEYRKPTRGAGRRFSARPRPATDSGGDAAFGAAGDVGDSQREARTPQFVRAADLLAQRGRPGSWRTSGRGCHGAFRPSPLERDQPEDRCGVGRCDGRSGAGGFGGAPLYLAALACAGRGTTPDARRQRHHRQTRGAG